MAQSASEFLNQGMSGQGASATDLLNQAVEQRPPDPAKARDARVMSASEFLERAAAGDPPPEKGFWADFGHDFGQATGGVTGLLKAPFTESIPAETLKFAARNKEEVIRESFNPALGFNPVVGTAVTAIKHLTAFLEQPAEKPLGDRMRESVRTLANTAKDHPGLVVGSLLKGMVSDPELFFAPGAVGVKAAAGTAKTAEALGASAKAAQTLGKTAGVATKVAGGAGLGAGAEAMREAGEGEAADTGAIGLSAAIGVLAAGLQIPLTRAKPKMTPAEITAVLATQPDPRAVPHTEIVPTHDGYAVQTGGRQVATFPTEEAAKAHATEIQKMGSAYSSVGAAPPGSAQAERARFIHDNPFTPEKMARMIRRPEQSSTMSGAQLARFWGRAAGAAAIGAAAGLLLDEDEPELGATFGAAITLLPRALSKDRRISIEDAINTRNGLLAQMSRRTFQFKSAIEAAVPEELRRNAISLALESGDAGVVEDPRGRVAGTQMKPVSTPGVVLSPAEQQVAQAVRTFFDSMGNTAVDAGVLKELLSNYVSHIVEEDPRASSSVVGGLVDAIMKRTNEAPPKSGKQFARHRKYATFGELQEALRGSGLKIKTGDIAQIVSIYSNAMFRTITDKRLLDALKASPVEPMPPQVMHASNVPGPAPGAAPRPKGTTIEGEQTYKFPEQPPPEQPAQLPPPAGQQLPTAAGSVPGERTLPAQPTEAPGFQLPNPPPDQPGAAARKFAARDRKLLQPIAQMDSNYEMSNNRQLAGFAVHKDISPQLNFIFSAKDPNDITVGLMALSQASKRAVISFSLFHAKSLADAFVGAMGTKAFTRGRSMVKSALEMYRKGGNNDDVDALLKHGLKVQVPEDVVTDEFNTALSRVANVVDRVLPVDAVGTAVHGVARFNEALDHFTFATLQTGFKLATSLDAMERLTTKGVPRDAAARMAASYANDIYGGLDWFRVANDVSSRIGRDAAYSFFNPNGRRIMQLLMFAPDWTFSTFRAAYKALPGAVDDPALAALHRRYLMKSAIYYLTVANALNFVTAGHSIFSNVNPTRVQLADGRTMQFSKHFMEPFEWLREPIQTAANKLAFIPRASVEIMTNKQYISVHDTAPDIESRAQTIAEMFLPINAQQGLAGGGAESLLGLVGMPIYGKTPEQKEQAHVEKRKSQREKRIKAAKYYEKLNQ